MPIHYIASAVHWLLKEAGAVVFGAVKQRLVDNMGLNTKTITPSNTPVLVDEYLHRFEERLAQRIIDRLDEDRIVKLNSAITQLKTAAKMATQTPFKQGHLLNAVGNFFDIANLPEQGITAGFQNAELRYLASLGIAAVYLEMKEPLEEDIANHIVTAIYADPVTAKLWFGNEVVARLLTICPQCGFENELTATFCIRDGHALPARRILNTPLGLKPGEVTGREIVEEQLRRARRRKGEMEEIISQARTIQYGSSDTPGILRKGQKSGGTRYEELSRERTEIAGISDIYVRERLEALRQRESSINQQTTETVKYHREALLNGRGMSREEFLEHWRAILAVYQKRLDVLDARIGELEAVQANSMTTRREIVEEQLKRARRRKREMEEIMSQARTIQYGSSAPTATILKKGQKSGGTRYEELSREKTEIAGISERYVRERLEAARQRESSINQQTTETVKYHREALLSGLMSKEEFLEHWRAILAVYQQRLDVLDARIRELEAVQTR